MKHLARTLGLWLVVGLMLVALFNVFSGQQTRPEPEVPFSEFLAQVKQNRISRVLIEGNTIHAQTVSRDHFRTYAPLRGPDLVNLLLSRNVHIAARPEQGDSWRVLATWLPVLLLAAVWIFLVRQTQSGDRKPVSSNPWGSS